jgi:sulfotransferase family protein
VTCKVVGCRFDLGDEMADTRAPMTKYPKADVLHIGYPKAASTFVYRYLQSHPEVTIDHNRLLPLLLSNSIANASATVEKSDPNKIHVCREESVAESVCVIGEIKNWERYLYVPGAWDRIKNDIIVDPAEMALRLNKVYPDAKVLLLIREQADWFQSIYKYVMSQLPATQRSFVDYCSTPQGIVMLSAGHFDRTIGAYIDIFGSQHVHVLRFEDILNAPKRFAAELCAFIGISERPIPQRRENESHALIARIQRVFPIVERLPSGVKAAIRAHVVPMLPSGRGTILSSRDIRMLRSIYITSNQRTEKLISLLSATAR